MWKKKNKQPVDERLEMESNRLAAKMFYVMALLAIISLVVKIICKLPIKVYALEILALAAGSIFALVCELKKGILFIKKDEVLQTIHEAVLAKAMMVMFWIFLFGDVVFLFVSGEYYFWVLANFAVVMIPALVITIASVKNGWLIWGSKKREVEGKKNFKWRVAIGALFYGVFMSFPKLYHDGAFHAEGILWVLGMAAGWGILFYVLFMAAMKIAEKKADKKLKEKEDESAE